MNPADTTAPATPDAGQGYAAPPPEMVAPSVTQQGLGEEGVPSPNLNNIEGSGVQLGMVDGLAPGSVTGQDESAAGIVPETGADNFAEPAIESTTSSMSPGIPVATEASSSSRVTQAVAPETPKNDSAPSEEQRTRESRIPKFRTLEGFDRSLAKSHPDLGGAGQTLEGLVGSGSGGKK